MPFSFQKEKEKVIKEIIDNPDKCAAKTHSKDGGELFKGNTWCREVEACVVPRRLSCRGCLRIYCMFQVHAKYFQLDITKSSYEHLSKGRVNVKEVCAVDIPGCRNTESSIQNPAKPKKSE